MLESGGSSLARDLNRERNTNRFPWFEHKGT